MRKETKKPIAQALLMKSGGTNNLKQNTMIKKMKKAGTAKKPCPPFCGEGLKEKFSSKGSRIGLGALAGMAATQAGVGIAKRLKGIKEEKDKAKKEGKTITRKEAKKSYLNKVRSGSASSMETQKRGGSTKSRAKK